MTNIIDIDNYFMNNYSKMMTVYPKVSNVVENMNDIVSNINYSIDTHITYCLIISLIR